MIKNKILIADDESDIALILKLQLEDAGYRTARAKDGAEALEMLAKEQYELLLLDIKMPKVDGMQVLRHVKNSYSATVVVMMTAHGNEEIAVQAMKDGALDYIAKPFSNDDMIKRVERAINYNRTLQENQNLQRQLAAEQKKTEAILQDMAELLLAVDADGSIISVNRMAEYILGLSRDQIIGKQVEDILTADFPADGALPLKRVLSSGTAAIDISYSIAGPLGKIPVLSSASPLYDDSGKLLGAVEIIRDISSLKALEREREDFVSMLTHDLKNPITSIVGSLDLVREGRLGPINPDQREFLESAEESCSEMVEMINSLLDIHKFEAGKMVMSFRDEKPAHLLEKIATQFTAVAAKQGLELHFEIQKNLTECLLDRTTFIRMIANLLSNAMKFTREGGSITVTAEIRDADAQETASMPKNLYPAALVPVTGRFLKIAVADTGAGIPADALGAIFDRFVQAENRRMGKTKGTGLGLAFCRKVMDAHKGLIWAESEEGQGSRFITLFPLPGSLAE